MYGIVVTFDGTVDVETLDPVEAHPTIQEILAHRLVARVSTEGRDLICAEADVETLNEAIAVKNNLILLDNISFIGVDGRPR